MPRFVPAALFVAVSLVAPLAIAQPPARPATTSSAELACSSLPTRELEVLARALAREATVVPVDSVECIVIFDAPTGTATRLETLVRAIEARRTTSRRPSH